MKFEYICNDCGWKIPPNQYEEQSDIFCVKCGGHIEENMTSTENVVFTEKHTIQPSTVLLIVATIIGFVGFSIEGKYGEDTGRAAATIITSPLSALILAPFNQVLSLVLLRFWLCFWPTYKATIFAHLWAATAITFGWIVAALTDSELIIGLIAIPCALLGMAWIYGHFLRDQRGGALGTRFGAKLIALQLVSIFLFAVVARLLGVTLRLP